ncbi:MAG: Panacea domain-containing protein [Candidatus Campbellbacteria bacterium]|nr:Panacea domain-containing protein [Candidatus Campbellbacteria bacterium]
MSVNIKKYENAVLYFIKHCNNEYLGDTKLMKLLYYLDFANYRDTKKSVTGDIYRHLDFGPVPIKAREIVASLEKDKKIEVEKIILTEGGHKNKYKAYANPSISVFTAREKKLLEKICRKFKKWTTKEIVAQTHLEAPWFYSKPSDKINYKYSADIDLI